LRSQAMANLSALAAKATWNDFHGAHLLHIDGNYESSMLALNDFWKTTTPKVDGDLVVIVPLRDMVLATGSNSHETVAMLRTLSHANPILRRRSHCHRLVSSRRITRRARAARLRDVSRRARRSE